MSNPHDKSLDRKHGTTRLESGVVNPPNRPRARRVDGVAVSRGNDMMNDVTNRGSSGSSARRGRRRLWGQRREPDPPAEVAQAARVLRRKTNPKLPELQRPCSVCSLKFRCWRELFAHMRTHPEKESRCMREIFPPLDSSAEREARDRRSSIEEGQELASTLLHTSPRANKDCRDRNAASSTATGSRGRDVAVASKGAGASSSAASASPLRQGSDFNFDLNKAPPEEEENNDGDGDSGLDSKGLPPEAEERGGQ